jgi:hypothetical protein
MKLQQARIKNKQLCNGKCVQISKTTFVDVVDGLDIEQD